MSRLWDGPGFSAKGDFAISIFIGSEGFSGSVIDPGYPPYGENGESGLDFSLSPLELLADLPLVVSS
jgi:hypothetical protein